MAYGTYLVVAEAKQLQKIANKIAKVADGGDSGDPLVAVGSTRALLGAAVAEMLAESNPGKTVAELLVALGAERVKTKSPSQVASLLDNREPSELLLERTDGGYGLVEDGHDWHIARTRLHQAWAQVGGPGQIDWEGIQVGQIDTGYTEHPCLGWKNGVSSVVNTRDDRNFFYEEMYGEDDRNAWGNRDPYSALDPYTGSAAGRSWAATTARRPRFRTSQFASTTASRSTGLPRRPSAVCRRKHAT